MLSLVVGVYIEDVIYKSFSILYYIHFLEKSVAKKHFLEKSVAKNKPFGKRFRPKLQTFWEKV